jgi:hypothetical protein
VQDLKGGIEMSIYRQYEDPYTLEQKLAEAKSMYRRAIEEGIDENVLMDMALEIHELEERVNFAWQDDQAESEGY